MADLVIRSGRVLTPDGLVEADVAVIGDRVVGIGSGLGGRRVLDAEGRIVGPGLVDLVTHSGQPGREQAESLASLAHAAALGGYTAVVIAADTDPVIDTAAAVHEIRSLAATVCCDIELSGTVTVGAEGTRLAPMGELAAMGVRLFGDGGQGIQDDRLMRRALEYASDLGITIVQRGENAALAAGGHMHEGPTASLLGIGAIPAEAEELMVMRDVALSRLTGGRIHFAQLSSRSSLAMLRAARAGGLPLTTSVTPHHLLLTDEDCVRYDPNRKVAPPLRSADDRAALVGGLLDGSIDAIATDHTPWENHLKELPFDTAPPGVIGLETALAATGELDLPIELRWALLSMRPASIAGIGDRHGVPVAVGSAANLTVFDPAPTWVAEGAAMASRSANTPFEGRTLAGRARHTVLHGDPVVVDSEVQR